MSLHYENGDLRRPYLQCDADGCRNRLRKGFLLAVPLMPSPDTGWKTEDPTGERRDFCAEHA